MRIIELLSALPRIAPLSPTEYAKVAAQRDAELRAKAHADKKKQEAEQRARQKKVWSKSRKAKPKKPKLRVKQRKQTSFATTKPRR